MTAQILLADDQAVGLIDTGGANPFKRRDSIARTPPRSRASSASSLCLDFLEQTEEDKSAVKECTNGEKPTKRKRTEGTPEMQPIVGGNSQKWIMDRLCHQINKLGKIVGDTYHPRKDLKAVAETLTRLAVQVQSGNNENKTKAGDKEAEEPKSDEKTKKKEEEVKKMSETVNDKQREMEKENAELKALISDLKSEIKTLKENTAADEDGQGVKKIKNDIDRATTNEEIMKVALKDWPKNIYKVTAVVEGSPLASQELEDDIALITIGEEEINMDKGLYKAIKDRYPGIEKNREEELTCISQVTTMETSEGVETINKRYIYRVHIKEAKDNEVLNAMKKIKEAAKNRQRKIIAWPKPTGIDTSKVRKYLEMCFKNIKIRIGIHIPKSKPLGQIPTETRSKQMENEGWKTQNNRKKNETIHIKPPQNVDPKTFAEVMKNVRKGIDAQQMGVLILDARTARAGGAKIKLVEKKEGAAKELIAKIQNIAGNDTTVKKLEEKQVAIIIRDLDKTIDREEIEKAIKDELDVKDTTTCVKVLGPRAPADGEGPNTALAIMPARWGKMLLKQRRIKIGWSRCRIVEKITPPRCYRCQQFGHASYACKSKEKTAQKCLNCGGEEHEAKDCKEEEACYICNKKGHRADSMRCERYREVVNKVRANRKGEESISK
ncbi:axoneme-associated protein mst101(2)-like [Tenebrio molitor]|uniref:axoneme-associated protein mst101(2)-like n=1 Tax=Tenebrio molitor TaxID=7067 RepID=UPI0036247E14